MRNPDPLLTKLPGPIQTAAREAQRRLGAPAGEVETVALELAAEALRDRFGDRAELVIAEAVLERRRERDEALAAGVAEERRPKLESLRRAG